MAVGVKVSWYVTTCRLVCRYTYVSEGRVVSIFRTVRSFATTVSQLKINEFSGVTFKGFEVLQFSISATTTQLLSSDEFCNLRYDTIPVKSASAKRFFLYQ